MADGHEVRTVEGLERDGTLDPVQQGFMEEHGLQCGFCTPGMMLTARALLDAQPEPDRRRRSGVAISGQICRCTGYKNIVNVDPLGRRAPAEPQEVSRLMATTEERPIGFGRHEAQGGPALHPRPGQLRRRRPACPGMLHGAVLRSPLAHARIISIDTSAAQQHPKVRAVITGKDLEGLGLAWMPTLSADTQAVLATDKVRFQGQEVAFVVADDRYAARDALELIDVEYEPLPVGRRRRAARSTPTRR